MVIRGSRLDRNITTALCSCHMSRSSGVAEEIWLNIVFTYTTREMLNAQHIKKNTWEVTWEATMSLIS